MKISPYAQARPIGYAERPLPSRGAGANPPAVQTAGERAPIDVAHVARLRADIVRGVYIIDADRIAQAMIDSARQTLTPRPSSD